MTKAIRQIHRWTSVLFTLAVLMAFTLPPLGVAVEWIYYTPLPFLFIQLATGLWLFASPYLRGTGAGSAP